VLFEEGVAYGYKYRLDILLQRGMDLTRRIYLETKAWNFDLIARFPERAAGMLRQLADQAAHYHAFLPETIYAFRQVATTPAGRQLMAQAEEIIIRHGLRFTYGVEQLLLEIEKTIPPI